jgi:hypothetical protein
MSEYKEVGTNKDTFGALLRHAFAGGGSNYMEPGVEIEAQVLAHAAARRDENRPLGKPFTLEPKAAPAIAVLNAKTAG